MRKAIGQRQRKNLPSGARHGAVGGYEWRQCRYVDGSEVDCQLFCLPMPTPANPNAERCVRTGTTRGLGIKQRSPQSAPKLRYTIAGQPQYNPTSQLRGGMNMATLQSRGTKCTSQSGCQPGEVCVAGTCMGWIRAVPPRTQPFHPPFVGAGSRRPPPVISANGRCQLDTVSGLWTCL